MTGTDRWGDLRVRLISAAVLIVASAADIYAGGPIFDLGVALLVGAMVWELARMTGGRHRVWQSLGLGVLAGFCHMLASLGWVTGLLVAVLMVLPSAGLLLTPRRDHRLSAVYALAIMVAGLGFVALRLHGPMVLFWLIMLVVMTDTLGYFVGRLLGGPKFWPQVSPNKTWSGTVAGWVGAALVGAGFWLAGTIPLALALASPFIAFAGQLGDITESWLKRRAGVKDSSRLIPGHGGVLDRFDALIGAVLAVQLMTPFVIGFAG